MWHNDRNAGTNDTGRRRPFRVFCSLFILCLFLLAACSRQEGKEDTGQPEVDSKISAELVYEGRTELKYATGFALDRFAGGYTLITIPDSGRFLVVPKEKEIPGGLEEDIVVLKQPVDRIYLAASAAMDMFRVLDGLSAVRLSGTDQDGWYIEEAKAAMERGEILYAGKYSTPDYELIRRENCELAVENRMITHAPEVREKLQKLGIPVLIDHSSQESEPMGRVEWVRLYGVLLDKEEEAEKAFARQDKAWQEASEGNQTALEHAPTVAFFYITTEGAVSVRKSSDYVPKMITLAGGRYVFDRLGDEEAKTSSVTMQMEEFYAAARNADYLIYNSSIDGEISSMDELLSKSALLKDFKAVQEGGVFCTTQNLYQETMSIGSMTEDIHRMLTGEGGEEMQYLYRVE